MPIDPQKVRWDNKRVLDSSGIKWDTDAGRSGSPESADGSQTSEPTPRVVVEQLTVRTDTHQGTKSLPPVAKANSRTRRVGIALLTILVVGGAIAGKLLNLY